jgi:hypothetical protein
MRIECEFVGFKTVFQATEDKSGNAGSDHYYEIIIVL